MRRAAKVDDTQREIVAALRKAGIAVQRIQAPNAGCPDAVLGFGGVNVLAEFKTGKRDVNEAQRDFINGWPGPVIVARTPEEAVSKFFEAYAVTVLRRV